MKLLKRLYQYIILFLRTKLSRVQYIMVVATLVGLASGLTAVLLKTLVHYLQHWIQDISISRFAYLLFPVIGLLITVILVSYFFNGYIEKGFGWF
jgi:CIC family chloride channel protein